MAGTIGEMRHRVLIERNDGAADGGGGSTENWIAVATLWARIEDFSSSPSSHAARASIRTGLQATIRHRSDVATGMRLTHEGETYRIRTVTDKDQRTRFLDLMCERVEGT